MEELHKIIKKKYKDFDITPPHLGHVIRDNNITRKRTRYEHYPKERYGKPTDIKKELKTFYKEGGMTKERVVDFLEANIFNKYKNHLIILDNAGSHNNEYVKQAIINSGNKYLFTIQYTPKTNPNEQYFNQIKHYLKLNKKVLHLCTFKTPTF